MEILGPRRGDLFDIVMEYLPLSLSRGTIPYGRERVEGHDRVKNDWLWRRREVRSSVVWYSWRIPLFNLAINTIHNTYILKYLLKLDVINIFT